MKLQHLELKNKKNHFFLGGAIQATIGAQGHFDMDEENAKRLLVQYPNKIVNEKDERYKPFMQIVDEKSAGYKEVMEADLKIAKKEIEDLKSQLLANVSKQEIASKDKEIADLKEALAGKDKEIADLKKKIK